ncbi:hypothetical protein ACET3Z_005894 [Daucus carota]
MIFQRAPQERRLWRTRSTLLVVSIFQSAPQERRLWRTRSILLVVSEQYLSKTSARGASSYFQLDSRALETPDSCTNKKTRKETKTDLQQISGVCRSWRSAATDIHKSFMERLQPLVFARSRYAKKACVLYNIFDSQNCKSMLPSMPRKYLWGLSSGYLITYDKNMGFWLVNLMTRHEMHYPVLSESSYSFFDFTPRAVLLRLTRLSRIFMIIFSENHNFLLMSESGSSSWQEYLLPNTSAGIADVKILDGKIFVLTCDAHFGEFNLRADPVLKLYNCNIPIQLPSRSILQLVTSDNKIYMVISQYRPCVTLLVQYLFLFELDYSMESAKQIHDLGSKSLFLSVYNSALVDTTGWGAGNCVEKMKSVVPCHDLTSFSNGC